MTDRIGQQLGNYRLIRLLGKGGFAEVYQGEHIHLGTHAAIKVLLLRMETPELEQFRNEARLVAQLSHPHIVRVLDFGIEGTTPYLVMDYAPNGSLRQRYPRGVLQPLASILPMVKQIAAALQYAHDCKFIHRDVKPDNLLLGRQHEVVLSDFGIAIVAQKTTTMLTQNGAGTPAYMAPEQILGKPRMASDQYSLGVVVYEWLCGNCPFTGTVWEVMYQQTNVSPPPLREKVPSIPSEVEQVVLQALAKDSSQRFASVQAFAIALEQAVLGMSAAKTPANASATIPIPAVSVSPNAPVVAPINRELVCPKCGFQNRPGAKFCQRDGQPLTQGATLPPPRVHAPAIARSLIQARPVQRPIQSRSIATVGSPLPGNPDGAYRLGLQQLNNKNYVEAIKQFKLAQVRGQPSYDVLYNLGRAYRQYGQSVREQNKKLYNEKLKQAAEQFEQAIKVKPDALDACFQLGMCYNDLGLYPQSTAAFQKGLQLSPKDPAIYYQLGMVAMAQSYKREAEAYFLEGLKINPDHVLILTALGRLYIEMNQVSSAINVLRQATQHDPALADGWYELGRAHMKERKWKRALEAFDQALQLSPDASNIYSAMALCYLKMNKRFEARQRADQALQLDQNNADALQVKKQLAKG